MLIMLGIGNYTLGGPIVLTISHVVGLYNGYVAITLPMSKLTRTSKVTYVFFVSKYLGVYVSLHYFVCECVFACLFVHV